MPPKYYKKYKKNDFEFKNANGSIFLVIVESPSKCSKIEHYLGPNYKCIASMGHLRQIKGLKSISTKDTFLPTFDIIEDKVDHIKKMDKIISEFTIENIFLATDDDREGEGIAWHICDLFKLPLTTKRIIFHEITKTAIQDAIKNPTVINMPLVMAQQTRQILDVIVGYKISPFLWKYLYNNKNNSLSAGRCQTPALRLIYDNEKNNSKELIKSYKINGIFTQKKIKFELEKQLENEELLLEFLENSKTHIYHLQVEPQKLSTINPPRPFCTSKLLQSANNVIQMSPKETMGHCQQLYQNGFITYMRTENTQYSKDFVNKAKDYIKKNLGEPFIGETEKITNTKSDNPHEAIRVTQIDVRAIANCKNSRMNTLYKLIWKNTIQSCMSNSVYYQNKLTIDAPLKNKYLGIIEYPKFLGWKAIDNKIDITEEQNKATFLINYLQDLISNKKDIICHKTSCEINCKKNHTYYNEASLIHKLETLEIGRPSTYSTIVETIKERGYVKKTDVPGEKLLCNNYEMVNNIITKKEEEKIFGNEKNKLVIEPIGVLALEFLTNYFDTIFSYEYTKDMEKQLDLISNNEIEDWSIICKNCYNELKESSKLVKNIKKHSYQIEDGYELIFEKYGPSIKHTLDDGTVSYLPTNPDISIDLHKLENKEYKLTDLMSNMSDSLGKYENEDVFVKNGKYGYYVEWGDKRESIKNIKTPISELNIQIITSFLEDKKINNTDNNILREINEDITIRKGKYGPYAFYKTKAMSKPKFLNIKKCPHGFIDCDKNDLINWLKEQYNL